MTRRLNAMWSVAALIVLTVIASNAGATTASTSHFLTFQRVRFVHCGTAGAVPEPIQPGSCVHLGRPVLGPGAFVLARRAAWYATGTNAEKMPAGPWVEVVISGGAKAVMEEEVGKAYSKPSKVQPRFDFVFNGHPLQADLGGDGVTIFVLAPNTRTARQIVASVCRKGCNKPFPGPTG